MLRQARIKERLKIAFKASMIGRATAEHSSRILTYHSVGNRDHPMNVSVPAFRDQIQWLAENTPCITVEQALDGQPGIAVTFDDGYRDNLINAQPVLEQHHVPWTLFFVAGRAGGVLDHDRSRQDATLLTWDEVRALQRSGVAVGGHTLTHPRLSALSADDQRREIEECYREIEREVGNAPSGFAYPFGSALDYTPATVDLVKQAGFGYAVSNRYGPLEPGDKWTARRIWIDRTDTLEFFQAKVDGRLDRLRVLDSAAGIRARRLAAPAG